MINERKKIRNWKIFFKKHTESYHSSEIRDLCNSEMTQRKASKFAIVYTLYEENWNPNEKSNFGFSYLGVILKPCGLIFGQMWPPLPLWTILLDIVIDLCGLFVKPLPLSGPHGLRMTPYKKVVQIVRCSARSFHLV